MTTEAGPSEPASADTKPPVRPLWRRSGGAVLRVGFDLLMVDAAVETWFSASPMRAWVVVPIAAYLLLTLWLVTQGARVGAGGWFMHPLAPPIVMLGVLAATSTSRPAMTEGLTLLGQPTPVVLAVASLGAVLAAGFRLAAPKGLPAWLRLVVGVVTAYAAAAFLMAVNNATPYADLLRDRSLWEPLPYWLRGAFVGSFLILPLALVGEVGGAMARLVLGTRLGWTLVFGLALWMAWNGFNA